jgi:hypothetical protein
VASPTRGERRWVSGSPVLVLDQGPDGYWVWFEDALDADGRPTIAQLAEKHLDVEDEGALF